MSAWSMYGYSWENDVVNERAVSEVLRALLPGDAETDRLVRRLIEESREIGRELLRWCEVDVELIRQGKGALFVRSSVLSLYDNIKTGPRLSASRVKGRLGSLGLQASASEKDIFVFRRGFETFVWKNGFAADVSRCSAASQYM